MTAAAAFTTSINRLLAQVSHWQQPRWSSPAVGRPVTRAEVTHELVQHLADLSAEAEHRSPLPVPREHDMVLPDQLRVMSSDLLTANPADDLLSRATAATEATHKALP